MTTPEAPADQTTEQAGERLRRDEPTRTAPNRQTANLLLPNASDTVEAGVNTAYEVCGRYLRHGQEAAQKATNQESTESTMRDRRNPWSFPDAPAAAGMAAIPLQLFRAWASLATTWAELSMIPGAAEGVRQMTKLVDEFWAAAGIPTGDSEPQSDKSPANDSRAQVRVTFEVASTQPVEVEIDFDPPSGVVPILQRLHPLRGEAEPLTALEFSYDPTSDRAKLSLAVPATQAPGRYTGTIFDDRDDRACGSVRVRVGD